MVDPNDVVGFIVKYVNDFTSNFVTLVYQSLSHYMETPINLGATILVALTGLGIAGGYIEASRKTLIFTTIKIWFVISLALHWDFFSKEFMDVINGTTQAVQNAILNAVPVHVTGATDLNSAMQVLYNDFYYMGHALLEKNGWDIVQKCEGIAIWILGILFVGVGLFETIFAKVGAAVLFAIAPFICIFYLAPFFKGMFERWVGLLMGFMIFNILITAVLTLFANMIAAMLPSPGDVSPDMSLVAIQIFAFAFVIVVGVFFLFKTESLGMFIGGGVSLGSGTMMIVGGVANIKGSLFGDGRGGDGDGDGSKGRFGRAWDYAKSVGSRNETSRP